MLPLRSFSNEIADKGRDSLDLPRLTAILRPNYGKSRNALTESWP